MQIPCRWVSALTVRYELKPRQARAPAHSAHITGRNPGVPDHTIAGGAGAYQGGHRATFEEADAVQQDGA